MNAPRIFGPSNDEVMVAYVGPGWHQHYKASFARRIRDEWYAFNWAAALVPLWLAWRRLWIAQLLSWITVAGLALALNQLELLHQPAWLPWVIAIVPVALAAGFAGDALVHLRAHRVIRRVRARHLTGETALTAIRKAGSVSLLAPLVLASLVALLLFVVVHPARAQQPRPIRPMHTFSIVAVDSATGQIGVAVQSHWFSVGGTVVWAEPGVGAVATQSFILPAYGPRGLALMRSGLTAPQAMHALLAADPDSAVRQLGMIDAAGHPASFTGQRDLPEAGSRVGRWYAAQANIMARNTVWDAMGRAFDSARGDLADRLLAALEAAQREGGDIRGQQSAAIIVVSGDRSLPPWDRIFDLRVEDNPHPIAELRRLVRVARAYRLATDGDNFMTRNQVDSAITAYRAASDVLPDSAVNGELVYWWAVTLADKGRVAEAIPLFRRAFARDTAWATLLWRLPRVGLLSADSATIARIVREARAR